MDSTHFFLQLLFFSFPYSIRLSELLYRFCFVLRSIWQKKKKRQRLCSMASMRCRQLHFTIPRLRVGHSASLAVPVQWQSTTTNTTTTTSWITSSGRRRLELGKNSFFFPSFFYTLPHKDQTTVPCSIQRRWECHIRRCFSSTNSNSYSTSSSATPYVSGRKASSLNTSTNLSFKVSRVLFDGSVETLYLDTAQLVKTASVFARDLFFTLNLTSRQERGSHYVRRTVSAILPRGGHSILLSFGNIRAVCHIQQGVLVFDAHQPAAQDFVSELAESFRQNASNSNNNNNNGADETAEPRELIFLEKVLRDTVELYHRRLRIFDPIVDSLLDRVDNNDIISPDTGVHQLGPLKDALQSFDIQVRQSQECLEDLLNNDDEMLDLLLTERQAADQSGRPVDFERHEHVEFLLGVYARQISNITVEINFLLQRLQSKQEFVTIALSGYRNRMVRMNVHLAIAGLSIAFSTALAGFFGMNVVHGFEQSTTAFGTIVILSSTGSLLISIGCLNFLSGRTMRQRAQKRLQEIEILTSALSDMPALDHAFKTTIERGQSLDKSSFAALLRNARHSKKASTEELDLLFDVFDKIKDEKLTADDFPSIKKFSS